MKRRLLYITASALLLIILWSLPTVSSRSFIYALTDVAILSLLVLSFNLLFGRLGLLSFGHAAYFGAGAYATGLGLLNFPDLSIPAAIALGTIAGGLVGLAIGSLCVRAKGTYFAMLTLAFGQLMFVIAWKWRSLTMGDDGFSGFAARETSIFGITLSSTDLLTMYIATVTVVTVASALTWMVMNTTPFGNIVISIKQNEQRAAFLGFNVYSVKLTVYTIAASLAGLAGSLSAVFHDMVSVSTIDLIRSTDVVVMAFLGGVSHIIGPVLGASVLVFGSDFLSRFTDSWQILLGAVFVAVVLYAPQGLAGLIGKLLQVSEGTGLNSSIRRVLWLTSR